MVNSYMGIAEKFFEVQQGVVFILRTLCVITLVSALKYISLSITVYREAEKTQGRLYQHVFSGVFPSPRQMRYNIAKSTVAATEPKLTYRSAGKE